MRRPIAILLIAWVGQPIFATELTPTANVHTVEASTLLGQRTVPSGAVVTASAFRRANNAHALRIQVEDQAFSEAAIIGVSDHTIDMGGLHIRAFKRGEDPSALGVDITGYGEHVVITDLGNGTAEDKAAVKRLREKMDNSSAKDRLARYRATLLEVLRQSASSDAVSSTTHTSAPQRTLPAIALDVTTDGFWTDCVNPWIAMVVDVAMVVVACSPVDAFWGCLWAIAWMTYDVPIEAASFACNCLGLC